MPSFRRVKKIHVVLVNGVNDGCVPDAYIPEAQALQIYQSLGFVQTCRVEDAEFSICVLTMQRRTCRWLGIRK